MTFFGIKIRAVVHENKITVSLHEPLQSPDGSRTPTTIKYVVSDSNSTLSLQNVIPPNTSAAISTWTSPVTINIYTPLGPLETKHTQMDYFFCIEMISPIFVQTCNYICNENVLCSYCLLVTICIANLAGFGFHPVSFPAPPSDPGRLVSYSACSGCQSVFLFFIVVPSV